MQDRKNAAGLPFLADLIIISQHSAAMENPSPPSPSSSGRDRQRVAIIVAALCFVALTFAFITGGEKSNPRGGGKESTDSSFGNVPGGTEVPGAEGVQEDWLNAPESGSGTAAASGGDVSVGGNVAANTGKPASSIVTGDDPVAVAATASAENGGTVTGSSRGQVGPEAPDAPAASFQAGAISQQPGKNTAAMSERSSTAKSVPVRQDDGRPQAAHGSGAPVASSVMPGKQPASASRTVSSAEPGTIGGEPTQDTRQSAATLKERASNMTSDPERPSLSDRNDTGSRTAEVSAGPRTADSRAALNRDTSIPAEFIRPKAPKRGISAQSRYLISESEYRAAMVPKTSASASSQTSSFDGKRSAPAHVTRDDAQTFANRATDQFRRAGHLTERQIIRLPRRAETTNHTVWRDDDAPATAQERRPFGLVIADQGAAFTQDGIPLRSDIAPGVSPLEKTGPDKPLWKRPD